jgi:hypothetical protein
LASSISEWLDCLVELIEDDDFRYQLAVNAQSTIKDKWFLSQNAVRWKDVFQKVIDNPCTSKLETPLMRIMQSINIQQEETLMRLKKENEKLIHSPRHLCKTVLLGLLAKSGLYHLLTNKHSERNIDRRKAITKPLP